jgi:chromosome segregation ATPase
VLKDYQNKVTDLEHFKTKEYLNLVNNLNAKIKYLENSMEKSIAAYNGALSKNNKLKNEINELRKDKKSQREAYCTLEQKVEELNCAIKNMEESISNKRANIDRMK